MVGQRSFWFGVLAGTGFSLIAACAVFTFRIVPYMRVMQDNLTATKQALDKTTENYQGLLKATYEAAQARRAQQLEASTTPTAQSGWYTLLYDQVPASVSPALQMLNLMRPGLGTVVAKLQPPNQTLALHWVLPGYVNPVSTPAGSVAVFTRNEQ